MGTRTLVEADLHSPGMWCLFSFARLLQLRDFAVQVAGLLDFQPFPANCLVGAQTIGRALKDDLTVAHDIHAL